MMKLFKRNKQEEPTNVDPHKEKKMRINNIISILEEFNKDKNHSQIFIQFLKELIQNNSKFDLELKMAFPEEEQLIATSGRCLMP